MKQIGLAITQYTQDYDELLPSSDSAANGGRWRNRIYPYTKSSQIFVCPSSQDAAPLFGAGQAGAGGSYAINGNVTPYALAGRHLAELADSSGTALITETGVYTTALVASADNNDATTWMTYNSGVSDWDFEPPGCWNVAYPACRTPVRYLDSSAGSANLRRPLPRHFDGANLVFADGHAKWMRIDRFLGPMPQGYDYGDVRNAWDNK